MNLIKELQKLINEHGCSSILRERLLLFKDQIADLEKERSDLKKALSNASETIAQLTRQLEAKTITEQFVEHRGALFKRKLSGGYDPSVYCPSCKSPLGCMDKSMPFYCGRCDIMLNFHGHELPSILEELKNLS